MNNTGKVKKLKENRVSSIVLHNLLIGVLAFIWLIPIVWLVCTSFSAYSGMNTSTFFPEKWSAVNYAKLFHPDTVAQFPQWFYVGSIKNGADQQGNDRDGKRR